MAKRSLQEFVEELNGESHLRVEQDYGDGFVRLRTSEAERRQAAQDIQCSENIVLELLRNSRDAHAANIFLAVSRTESKRTITVIDDGDGIPAAMHKLVFEPRVTSKLDTSHMDAWGLHGRGMALFSIAQNSQSARIVSSGSNLGCALTVITDINSLPEKADQSSFPKFFMDEGHHVNVRGPRNILRTACEFAIESRDQCSVYVGSPAEIVATVYNFGLSKLSAIDRVFCKDESALPIPKRLATSSDPEDLAEGARKLGLEISHRTARRVIDSEIEEALPLLDRIVIQSSTDKRKGRKATRGMRRIKIHQNDREFLADSIMPAFSEIAERYYLEQDVEPRVSTASEKLVITIPLVEKA